jgi:SP family general alpha glucoside:H+ symporter-like MFS transporter
MSSGKEQKNDATHIDVVDPEIHEKGVNHPEVLSDKDLMDNAFEAENREHEMGMWEAFKDHPVACFWAFLFCFTIVRFNTFCSLITS